MSDTEVKLRAIIADTLGVSGSEIRPDVDFLKDLQMDSLDLIEVIMEIEKVFGIMIPDQEVTNDILNYKSFLEYIEGKINPDITP